MEVSPKVRINVLIPAYNCSKTLPDTLESLCAQYDKRFKVTVIDDCSTEDIKSIVDIYADRLNITYIRNEKNMTCCMSRQVGMDNNDCDYFCFLDSDDFFLKHTIQEFNKLIEEYPDAGYITGTIYEELPDGSVKLIRNDRYCHSKLYKASDIKKYDIHMYSDLRWNDDAYLNYVVIGLLNGISVPIPLYLYSYNEASVTRRSDPVRKLLSSEDFFNGMVRATDHVLKYKDHFNILPIILAKANLSELSENAMKHYEYLKTKV